VGANCPACGQPLPLLKGIRSDPATRVVIRDGRGVYLPPVPFALFDCVYRAYPAGLTKERLIRAVYADDPEGGPNRVAAMMVGINRRLQPLAMEITARGGPGSEYRLIMGDMK
jgi:DNA-binding response OmpR family regulator